MKKVLILGAGLVAKPMVDYLLKTKEFEIILATRTVSKAEHILQGRENGIALPLLIENEKELENLIENADLAVSLLPYIYHVKVAKLCLKHGKHLVTTSYVSDEMTALNRKAIERGVLFLNEIGLDPGIDHMSAMRIIHEVQKKGGTVAEFRSYCGGIPAPEANNNPWGYKFSWSPRGVLMAGRNNARYLSHSKIVQIDGKDLFNNHWPIDIENLKLETYPNRDSLGYINLYGLKDVQTMYRGTLRYPSWCRTLAAVSQLGLLGENPLKNTKGKTNREIFCSALELPENKNLRNLISGKLPLEGKDEILNKLEWLGLFGKEKFEFDVKTPIGFLTMLMSRKMRYAPEERDMIVLHHDFLAEYPLQKEHITSTLIDYGIPNGDSSMSRTVSLPAAIAVKLILEGEITSVGVKIPVKPEIYNPVLSELETQGIIFKEKKLKITQTDSTPPPN